MKGKINLEDHLSLYITLVLSDLEDAQASFYSDLIPTQFEYNCKGLALTTMRSHLHAVTEFGPWVAS